MNPRTVSLLAAVLGGCAPRCGGPPPPPPAVEYAGCLAVVRGPTCELKPGRELRLLAGVPRGARLLVLASGREIDASEGGLRAVRVPAGAAAIEVVLVDASGRRSAPWRLAVGDPARAPVLAQAMELVPRGGIADAAKLLAEHRAELSEEDRARADSMIARASLATGHPDEGIALLERSAAEHERLGHVAEATRDTFAQAFTLIDLWRFEEARAALAAADRRTRDYDEGRAQAAYYRGVLSKESGDLRSALRQMEDAASAAGRLGMALDHEAALVVRASILRMLGRPREALERLKELHPQDACNRGAVANNAAWAMLASVDESLGDPVPPLEQALAVFRTECPRQPEVANQLVNLALAHLRRGDLDAAAARLKEARGEGGLREPRQALWWLDIEARIALGRGQGAEALGLYRRLEALAAASGSGEGRWRAAVGKAEALAARGDMPGALRAHEEADRLLDAEALLVPLTEGREHFLADRERGARHHVMLLIGEGRTSEAMLAARRTRARFLQAVGLGQKLSALGPAERTAWDRALSSYRRGRAELEAEAAQDWALAEDQLRQVTERRRARSVALRRALDDAMAALGATAAPSSALRSPEPGELLLMWFPAGDRWYGFAAAAGKTVAHALAAAPDLKDGGAALLQPFDREVDAAAQVTVIPYGALRGVDLHSATWRGAPLAASKPVAYAVDLPAAKAVAPPDADGGSSRSDDSRRNLPAAPQDAGGSSGSDDSRRNLPAAPQDAGGSSGSGDPLRNLPDAGGGSLVIGDPLRNLPQARREAEAVHAALQGRGQPSTLLIGEQATRSALRQALSSARHLHYAGHGRFGGEGGWDSALPLADGELTAGDILTLQVPPAVVLAGCETGRAAEGPLESIGLAQAFILAGARAVIAASRPVDDRTTARLSEALYEADGRPEPAALPERLRRAQRKLRDEGADWSAFRVLVQ